MCQRKDASVNSVSSRSTSAKYAQVTNTDAKTVRNLQLTCFFPNTLYVYLKNTARSLILKVSLISTLYCICFVCQHWLMNSSLAWLITDLINWSIYYCSGSFTARASMESDWLKEMTQRDRQTGRHLEVVYTFFVKKTKICKKKKKRF